MTERKMIDPHGSKHPEGSQCKYSGCQPTADELAADGELIPIRVGACHTTIMQNRKAVFHGTNEEAAAYLHRWYSEKPVILKPCPFCGGDAEFERKGNSRVSCIVRCTQCNCIHSSSDTWDSGSSWNTRAGEVGLENDLTFLVETYRAEIQSHNQTFDSYDDSTIIHKLTPRQIRTVKSWGVKTPADQRIVLAAISSPVMPEYMQIPKALKDMTTEEAIKTLELQKKRLDKALERLNKSNLKPSTHDTAPHTMAFPKFMVSNTVKMHVCVGDSNCLHAESSWLTCYACQRDRKIDQIAKDNGLSKDMVKQILNALPTLEKDLREGKLHSHDEVFGNE
jgi:hypothetical protein